MKKLKTFASIITLAFLAAMCFFAINVHSLTYEVGVRVNDWAEYRYSFDFTINPPQPLPPEFKEAEQVSHSHVIVKEIFDNTSLKLQETIFYKNGSQRTNILIGNIETGGGKIDSKEVVISIQLIAKNLGVGDKISTGPGAPEINETKPMSYAGATREVNRACVFKFSPFGENYTEVDFYWDKETGILCEMKMKNYMTTEDGKTIITIIHCVIVETNLWAREASKFEWMTFAVFIIVVTAGFLYVFRKPIVKRFRRRRLKRFHR